MPIKAIRWISVAFLVAVQIGCATTNTTNDSIEYWMGKPLLGVGDPCSVDIPCAYGNVCMSPPGGRPDEGICCKPDMIGDTVMGYICGDGIYLRAYSVPW